MPSTYVSYRLYSQDLPKSLNRVAAQPTVRREGEYYARTIGRVTSVDDFLDDHRLYAYAMKAHGLEDMIYAKAFMKKVLRSDLSDPKSFANKLVDRRYRDFARMFAFRPDGRVASSLPAQDAQQENETVGLYSAHIVRASRTAASETAHARAALRDIRSLDQLLADDRLRSYLVTAFGLDATYTTASPLRQALTSDLSDPASFARASGDPRYIALAGSFGFAPDGTLPAGQPAVSAAQLDDITERYAQSVNGGVNTIRADALRRHYEATIGSITSVDDLVNDPDLRTAVVVAFGIAAPEDASSVGAGLIRSILTSDLSDPASAANRFVPDLSDPMVRAFNFALDGTVPAGEPAQAEASVTATVEALLRKFSEPDTVQTPYFRTQLDTIRAVDDLLNNSRLVDYLVAAYDLKGASASHETIARALRSDPSDEKGWLRQQSDPQLIELAWDFNFGADGRVAPRRSAQSPAEIERIARDFKAAAGRDIASQRQADREVDHYKSAIFRVRSAKDFVEDRRLVDVALRAVGLSGDRRMTPATLTRILTSDLDDPRSYASSSGDPRVTDLAVRFGFAADGGLRQDAAGQVQSRKALAETQQRFVRQTLEVQAGEQSEGARLALYFRRMAPGIKTAYDLLADKALLEVVTTALGIPSTARQANVDTLARTISKRLRIADLHDPRTLDSFLSRFATLHDLKQAGPASSFPMPFGRLRG